MGPEAKGWAVTDSNVQTLSLLFKSLENHKHGGATPIQYPGYNYATPATPIQATLTEVAASGFLSPGASVGARFAYQDSVGLETQACPEVALTLSPIPDRPDTPSFADPSATPVPGAVGGGTYIYAITKRKGSGETQISNTVSVNVPFDATQSYIVPLTFDPIATYTDGTDSLCIYRSTGYDTAFKLIRVIGTGGIGDTNTTTYNDDGTITDINQAPPTTNTFDRNRKVTFDWTTFSHPTTAKRFRIYVTQQPGIYGTNNLFYDWDMQDPSTPLPSSVDYLGTEIMTQGWPRENTEITSNPPKVYLRNEAYGGPVLTEPMDCAGWQSYRFQFPVGLVNATPIDGSAYVETSTATPQFRVRLGGNYQTLVAAGATYAHATDEPGGHSTGRVLYPAPGGTTVKNVLDVIATPVGDRSGGVVRKNVGIFQKATATPVDLICSSSAVASVPDMTITISPDFAGQWSDVIFNGSFYSAAFGATLTLNLQIDGSDTAGNETLRSWTVPTSTPCHMPLSINFATPITKSNTVINLRWKMSSGSVTSLGGRRSLVGKVLF